MPDSSLYVVAIFALDILGEKKAPYILKEKIIVNKNDTIIIGPILNLNLKIKPNNKANNGTIPNTI